MKPTQRMGFNCAYHPTGAFVLRWIGASSQTFATSRDAAAFLREAADWIEKKKPPPVKRANWLVRWWRWCFE